MKPIERYIDYCWRINTEVDDDKRHDLEQQRIGFVQGMADEGYRYQYATAADMEFINLGIDRPMCCGVLLDIRENGVLQPKEFYQKKDTA